LIVLQHYLIHTEIVHECRLDSTDMAFIQQESPASPYFIQGGQPILFGLLCRQRAPEYLIWSSTIMNIPMLRSWKRTSYQPSRQLGVLVSNVPQTALQQIQRSSYGTQSTSSRAPLRCLMAVL
jgi:hypothetical protein